MCISDTEIACRDKTASGKSAAHTGRGITSAVEKLLQLLGQHILQARDGPPEITDVISIYISLGNSQVFGSV